MYAVVKTGGKQYRVSTGDTIQVEKLEGEPGQRIELKDVLLVANGESVTIGRPFLQGVTVDAEILDQNKHRKVIIYKFRHRKRYRRKTGHRQPFTALKITGINSGVAAPAPA